MILSDSKPSKIQSLLTPIQWVHAYWVSRCIYVIAKLGIADLLKDGSQHCDALAAATNTHSDSLYRVLRSLAGLGIFAEIQPRCFELTPLADCLQSNVPGSIRDMAIFRGEEHYYKSWGDLMYSLQTGKSAFEYLYNMDLFEYNEQNPLQGEIFDRAMTSSKDEYTEFLKAYDFSSIGTLVDVGGGKGSFLSAVLEANPTMTGILFDQPEVIDRAKNSHQFLNNRCQLVGGSFFEGIPEGGDAYVLKHIIQDWDDRRSCAILRNCYQAMGKYARLLVIDFVLPPANEPSESKFIDVNMLVMCPGGCIRTEAEFRELFKSVGFKLNKVIPTQSEVSILEGVKITS
ncbi:methyltransferase [Scytonema sp. NUACC26]|uniref:methyltransferase n=1 Tax=Scytonema sp. NUACC26 TaxID=3140176 RepID=UPI0034DBD1A5